MQETLKRKLVKTMFLCLIGGAIYCILEVLWRGYSHWSMFLVAAALTLPLDQVNEHTSWETPFWLQVILGGIAITLAELCAGLLLNICLGLDVWDYSHLPLNLWGQICVQYSLLWLALSAFGIVLFDVLRWWLFGEEMPHYRWKPRSREGGDDA